MLAERLDDVLADLPLVHLVRTVDQPLRADLRVPFRQRRILAEAERAVQLDRGVDHLVHHVGMEDLGDRVLLPEFESAFHLVRQVQNHQPGQVELLGAVRQHPLDALPIGDPLAERDPLACACRRHVKRRLSFRYAPHPVPKSTVTEAVLPHREALPEAAEDVVLGDDEIADTHLCVAHLDLVAEARFGVLVENRDVADDLEARIGKLDEESGVPLMTWRVGIGHRHHEGQLRDAGSGGEPLLAVENPVGAVAHRGRLHARGIGAGGLLRHREAHPDVAVDERDEVTLLLLLGAVFDQCQHRRVLRPHAVQRPRAEVRERPADLDLDDRVLEVAQPHPAVLDGHERTPQTFRACLRLHVGDDVEERPGPDLGFGRQHDGVDEVGDPCSQVHDVLRQFEIDHVTHTDSVDSLCQQCIF